MITALTIWFIGYGITEGVTGGDAKFLSWPVGLGEWLRAQVNKGDEV